MALRISHQCRGAFPLPLLYGLLLLGACEATGVGLTPAAPSYLSSSGQGARQSTFPDDPAPLDVAEAPADIDEPSLDSWSGPESDAALEVCGNAICEPTESSATCALDCPLYCGDGVCSAHEAALTCPDDCEALCGDGACTPGESVDVCPQDCSSVCGDGVCHSGEDTLSCPSDCVSACGDGYCAVGETPQNCPGDCQGGCGDGQCAGDETTGSCPTDCPSTCGDGLCSANGESALVCPEDCPSICGDGACTGNEHNISCPTDCQEGCGDGVCAPGEGPEGCPEDCPLPCGDGICGVGEDAATCPEDCSAVCGDGVCVQGESCQVDCMPQPPPLVPIYRHYYGNGPDSDHMFSHQSTPPPFYDFDGFAFELFGEPAAGLVPLYQSFCAQCTDHFQTTVSGEGAPDYANEIVLGYCSAEASALTPTYLQRMYHPHASDHVVTPKAEEIDYGLSLGYVLEGGCWIP